MKPGIGTKHQWDILRELLRNYQAAILKPWVARALLFLREEFADERLRVVAREILLHDGDWDGVRRYLSAHPAPWHKDLFHWAEKIRGGAK